MEYVMKESNQVTQQPNSELNSNLATKILIPSTQQPQSSLQPHYLSFRQFLQEVKTFPRDQTNQSSEFLKLLTFLVAQIENLYLTQQQQVQWIQLVRQMVELFCRNGELKELPNQQDRYNRLESIAEKIKGLEKKVQLKHKSCAEIWQFVMSKNQITQNKNIAHFYQQKTFSVHFSDFKFDMDEDQLTKLAAIVRNLCENDLNAFSFISLYLQESIQSHFGLYTTFRKLSQKLSDGLKLLQSQYPANSNEQKAKQQKQQNKEPEKEQAIQQAKAQMPDLSLVNQTKINNKAKPLKKPQKPTLHPQLLKKSSYEFQKVPFDPNSNQPYLKQLKQHIIKSAQNASNDQKLFIELTKKICTKRGYCFVSDLKIKSEKNIWSINRTVEKLVEDIIEGNKEKHKEKIEKVMESVNQKYVELVHQAEQQQADNLIEKYQQLVEFELGSMQPVIEEILRQEDKVSFAAKDLLRGKCTFNSLNQLITTCNQLVQHIIAKGYLIVDSKDRSTQKTKDIALYIKLPNSIAELQLVPKLDSVANEFNHKIYELKRSNLYSLITNLFIHNRRWSEEFFGVQAKLVEDVAQLNQWNIKFCDKVTTHMIAQSYQNKHIRKMSNDEDGVQLEGQSKTDEEINEQLMKELSSRVGEVRRFMKQRISLNQPQLSSEASITSQQLNSHITHIIQSLKGPFPPTPQDFYINFYYRHQDYSKAQGLLEKLELSKQTNNEMKTIKLRGDILYANGKYSQAIAAYEEWINLKPQNPKNKLDTQDKEVKQQGYQDYVEWMEVMSNIANSHLQQGQANLALQLYQQVYQQDILIYPTHQLTAEHCILLLNLLNSMAITYQRLYMYEKAKQFYNRSLQITQELFGRSQSLYLRALSNIASYYIAIDDFNQSEEYQRMCLQISIKYKGKFSEQVAMCLNNLGAINLKQGHSQKALTYFQRSLQIYDHLKGKDSLDYANRLQNIAVTLGRNRQYEKQLEMLNQVMKLKQILFQNSRNDSQMADLITNLGINKYYLKRYPQAINDLNSAMKMFISLKGQNCKQVASIYDTLGFAYSETDNITKSLQCFQKSLSIRTITFSPKSLQTSKSLNSLGIFYNQIKNYTESLKHYHQSLEIKQDILGSQAFDVAQLRNNIASVYYKTKEHGKQIEQYVKVLPIYERVKGKESIQVAEVLGRMTSAYVWQEDWHKAVDCGERSIAIRNKLGVKCDKDRTECAVIKSCLSKAYEKLGRYQQAREAASSSFETLKSIFGMSNNTTKAAYQRTLQCERSFHVNNLKQQSQKVKQSCSIY